MSCEKILQFGEKKIILIGTAHISEASVAEVKERISAENPDFVGIELDEQRLESLKNPNSWEKLDIVKVLKTGRGFLLLANIALSSFQKRMGANVGAKPGDEMRAACETAESMGIPAVMIDRPIQTTLSRAWRKNSLWGKAKLLSALLASAFSNEKISSEEIEGLKNTSEMDSMMADLAKEMPEVKTVLIDERDKYLACKIWQTLQAAPQKPDGAETSLVAVLGAGHLPGVCAHLEGLAAQKESDDIAEISQLPPKGIGAKIANFAFPAAIAALIVAGFFVGGKSQSGKMALNWLLWNCSLAFAGTLAAAAHPLTLLTAIVGAPIGTMSPVLGVGLFTGIVEATVRKPLVADLSHLSDDALSLRGFYKNRFLHALLVFFLSSLGGAIGNFIAVPSLIANLLK